MHGNDARIAELVHHLVIPVQHGPLDLARILVPGSRLDIIILVHDKDLEPCILVVRSGYKK